MSASAENPAVSHRSLQALLAGSTWEDISPLAHDLLLVVPVGSTEQHGPHLPLSTDTDVALALARALARRDQRVVVAPPVSYGASGEHAGFAGTLSIGREVLEALLVEIGRSGDDFAAILFLNAHGGNARPVSSAVATLRSEGRAAQCWSPTPGDRHDSHAGRTETSFLLAVAPESVRVERMAAGRVADLATLMPALIEGGVASVSPNGVLGDPRGASAREGSELLDQWVSSLQDEVDLILGSAGSCQAHSGGGTRPR